MRHRRLLLMLCWILLLSLLAQATPSLSTIRGHVTFNGQPVKNALVLAFSQTGQQKSALTDISGNYVLSNLAAGNYVLTVAHAQYVVDDKDNIAHGYKLVEVADNTTDVNFSLVKGGVITGYVQDVSGQPIVGQQILYEKSDTAQGAFALMSLRAEVRTDDRGYFRIYGLLPSKYTVGIGENPYHDLGKLKSPFNLTYYAASGGSGTAAEIDLASGQEIDLGKLEVRGREKLFSAQMQFVNSEGQPLSNFEFDLVQLDAAQTPLRTSFRTDTTGTRHIKNLVPARYQILPAVSNGRVATGSFNPVPFNITNKDIADLVITADTDTVTISGSVSIQETGPATNQDCTIALKEGDDLLAQDKTIYQIKLDSNGKFQLSGLRKTTYTLVVMPSKPSLQYDFAEVDDQIFRGNAIWGRLSLNLQTGPKTLRISLKSQYPER